jgi:outer membrane protein OmpA-like peptidoglycan-associated protein
MSNNDDDETQNYGLILLTAVVGAVVTAVLVYAVAHRTNGHASSQASSQAHPVAAARTVTADQAKAPSASSPSRTMPITPPMITSQAPVAVVPEPAKAAAAALEQRVYFEVNSEALPVEATEALKKIATAAKEQPTKNVLISGFHDASGNPTKNADLAKRRAIAVRNALEAQGVSANRLVLEKPALTAGGTAPMEARRVEMRLN